MPRSSGSARPASTPSRSPPASPSAGRRTTMPAAPGRRPRGRDGPLPCPAERYGHIKPQVHPMVRMRAPCRAAARRARPRPGGLVSRPSTRGRTCPMPSTCPATRWGALPAQALPGAPGGARLRGQISAPIWRVATISPQWSWRRRAGCPATRATIASSPRRRSTAGRGRCSFCFADTTRHAAKAAPASTPTGCRHRRVS